MPIIENCDKIKPIWGITNKKSKQLKCLKQYGSISGPYEKKKHCIGLNITYLRYINPP